ncbi:hypothetical protein J4231_00095 [Candidatus Woesearchaeota archaeon]|nr:hypothetical protein [Candidatus Woesearchaeota archaeon]
MRHKEQNYRKREKFVESVESSGINLSENFSHTSEKVFMLLARGYKRLKAGRKIYLYLNKINTGTLEKQEIKMISRALFHTYKSDKEYLRRFNHLPESSVLISDYKHSKKPYEVPLDIDPETGDVELPQTKGTKIPLESIVGSTNSR